MSKTSKSLPEINDAHTLDMWWTGYALGRTDAPPDEDDVKAHADGFEAGRRDRDATGAQAERVKRHDAMTEHVRKWAALHAAETRMREAAEKDRDGTFAAAAAAAPKGDPLTVACPECMSAPGQKCQNYKHQHCAPHRARNQLAKDAAFTRANPDEGCLDAAGMEQLRDELAAV